MKMKRKGFTMAELLIVITVIGVLASMMMVSSNEAVATSRATDIIANLRALKGAALMHYVDSMDYYNSNTDDSVKLKIENLRKYVDREAGEEGSKLGQGDGYFAFEATADGIKGRWYVGYIFNKNDTDIIPKLTARAKSLALLKAAGASDGNEDAGTVTAEELFAGGSAVAMKVR